MPPKSVTELKRESCKRERDDELRNNDGFMQFVRDILRRQKINTRNKKHQENQHSQSQWDDSSEIQQPAE